MRPLYAAVLETEYVIGYVHIRVNVDSFLFKEVLVLVGTVSMEAECLGFCDGKPSCLGVHIHPFPSAEYQVTGSNSFANKGTSSSSLLVYWGLRTPMLSYRGRETNVLPME